MTALTSERVKKSITLWQPSCKRHLSREDASKVDHYLTGYSWAPTSATLDFQFAGGVR